MSDSRKPKTDALARRVAELEARISALEDALEDEACLTAQQRSRIELLNSLNAEELAMVDALISQLASKRSDYE